MAEELQSLLEKIQREGIEKASAERDKILADAQSQAQAIIAEARSGAEKILSEAAKDAETMQKRSENAIRQAARDILLELKSELKKRLENITRKSLDNALNAGLMAEIIRDIAAAAANKNSADSGKLEAMVAPAKCEELIAQLTTAVGADFAAGGSIFPSSAAGRGLKVSVEGDQVFFDLSDTALTEMICEYAGSRVSAVLTAQDN